MNILLVDNGTSYLPQLSELLPEGHVTTVPFEKLRAGTLNTYDLIVLSGGHRFPVKWHRSQYKRELRLIEGATKPVIGICLGLELIVVAFGGQLKFLRRKLHDDILVTPTGHDPLTEGLRSFRVFESHRSAVKRLPDELVPLAESKYGVEIIRHATRPIYGFQFHPEQTAKGPAKELIRRATDLLSAP